VHEKRAVFAARFFMDWAYAGEGYQPGLITRGEKKRWEKRCKDVKKRCASVVKTAKTLGKAL